MRVGVMDLQCPGWASRLVPLLDELGYSRYWATEHHSPNQSASPTLMATVAAQLGRNLRVGTAGVLLKVHAPLEVVENFRLLQTLFPGRIDLGLAGAVPPEPTLSSLLDGRSLPGEEEYAARVRTVVGLVRGELVPGQPPPASIGPVAAGSPQLWLCGTSGRSAALAAELGIAYSFHDYLVTSNARSDDSVFKLGPSMVAGYRRRFRPNPAQPAPAFNVACYGLCADSEDQAQALWRSQFAGAGDSAPRRPSFCGTPDQCREQLQGIADRYDAEELIVQSLAPSVDACLRSYRLLADVLGLVRPAPLAHPTRERGPSPTVLATP